MMAVGVLDSEKTSEFEHVTIVPETAQAEVRFIDCVMMNDKRYHYGLRSCDVIV